MVQEAATAVQAAAVVAEVRRQSFSSGRLFVCLGKNHRDRCMLHTHVLLCNAVLDL